MVGDACGGADLVERIRAGDKHAEEELFQRYNRGICCILRQRGATQDVAQDLYQETVTLVIEKIRKGEIREPDRLSSFICAVARNLLIAHFRKSSRMSPISESELNVLSPCDQHEHLLRKEEAQIVRRVLSELKTERDRQIIVRYYLGEEDKAEICKDLGLNGEHFSRVLYRARQRFREAFDLHCKNRASQLAKDKDKDKVRL
jgi:RNA polymerase sigma-70 factor, ECF subfamily